MDNKFLSGPLAKAIAVTSVLKSIFLLHSKVGDKLAYWYTKVDIFFCFCSAAPGLFSGRRFGTSKK